MNVGEIQRKLGCWAEQDPERKFYDLYPFLCDKDWLRLAHDYVAQNAGSQTAGCDGLTMKLLDEQLEVHLETLRQELQSETFEPYPVRRVYIPKSNGKRRPLGVSSIRDRIVQEALRMILEPIYEADFRPYSFGFRPNHCTMDAIKYITWSTQEEKKYFWVIEADICSYFDTIHHRKLVKLLYRRIEDRKIIRLIWKFLRAGIMDGEVFQHTNLGISQGSILSPLLANVYLNELDRHIHERYTGFSSQEKTKRRRQGLANFVYTRYADDWLLLSNGTKEQVQQVKQELHQFLNSKLKLTLSLEKTKITHLNDGFRFLGFWIQRRLGSKGVRTKVLIPQDAVKTLIGKVATITNRTTTRDSVNSTILALNQVIGGWCRYYQHTSKASTTFNRIDYRVFWPMAHWLARKYRLGMPQVMRQYCQGNTLATKQYRLVRATDFPTLRDYNCYPKPNPYTRREIRLQREKPRLETYWTGRESRPSMADLRPVILDRDHHTCQLCDQGPLPPSHLQIDHIRPVRRFKRPVDANTPENLWTLCILCHKEKTKSDRQMESRVAVKVARPVRRRA